MILPQLKIAFDSGRCPQRCVYADTLCLSHTHMDHVGGAGFYIATRDLISLPPPTVLLPASRADAFEIGTQRRLFTSHIFKHINSVVSSLNNNA